MIYNSGTTINTYSGGQTRQGMQGPSSRISGEQNQYGSSSFTGNRNARTNTYSFNNATFDPYKGHLSILRQPGVTYGPLEDPYAFGGTGRKTVQQYANDYLKNATAVVKVTDPMGRSTNTMHAATEVKMGSAGLGGEISLMQLQQTMGELKAKAQKQMTASYNRNVPAAQRVTNITTTQNIMEKILPGVMSDARTTIVKGTTVPLMGTSNPYIITHTYDTVTQKAKSFWVNYRIPKTTPIEWVEDVVEENMLWKQNMYHGSDYEEGPDTKDKTKETLKTIEATGNIVTTELGDTKFKKTKEFAKAETEGNKKEAALKKKIDEKKRAGYLLGAMR